MASLYHLNDKHNRIIGHADYDGINLCIVFPLPDFTCSNFFSEILSNYRCVVHLYYLPSQDLHMNRLAICINNYRSYNVTICVTGLVYSSIAIVWQSEVTKYEMKMLKLIFPIIIF